MNNIAENKETTNILLIGNGFDLAHGLPTSYRNFLDFIGILIKSQDDKFTNFNFDKFFTNLVNTSSVNDYAKNFELSLKSMNKNILLDDSYKNKLSKNFEKIFYLIKDNIWYKHFSEILSKNGGWIDLEKEISRIIISSEAYFKTVNYMPIKYKSYRFEKETQKYFENLKHFLNYSNLDKSQEQITKEEFIQIITSELNDFINCFQIYIYKFIDICIKKDLENDSENYLKPLDFFGNLKPIDKIICFNYSHTYKILESIISDDIKIKAINEIDYSEFVHHVHGEAKDFTGKLDNISNNMVLGIDEFLSDEEKNSNLDFIKFKKYFQRIHKKTGNKYKQWTTNKFKEYEKDTSKPRPEINLFIFGHSLDITDKDILLELIDNPYTKTTIFYHSDTEYTKKIINLVKLLGQDKLIEKTGNNSIRFRDYINEDTEEPWIIFLNKSI